MAMSHDSTSSSSFQNSLLYNCAASPFAGQSLSRIPASHRAASDPPDLYLIHMYQVPGHRKPIDHTRWLCRSKSSFCTLTMLVMYWPYLIKQLSDVQSGGSGKLTSCWWRPWWLPPGPAWCAGTGRADKALTPGTCIFFPLQRGAKERNLARECLPECGHLLG